MYVHQQDWDNAQRVAELHCPESVPDILIGQVDIYMREGEREGGRGLLLLCFRQEQHLNRRTIRKQRVIY